MSEPMKDLAAELRFAEETVKEELVGEKKPKRGRKAVEKDSEVEKRRSELLSLSEDGSIKQSVASINKMGNEAINRLYDELEKKRQERVVDHLCDTLLSRFSQLMGATGSVVSPDELENDLKQDALLRDDVKMALSYVVPWLPLLGVLSGVIAVVKHIYWGKESVQATNQRGRDDSAPKP